MEEMRNFRVLAELLETSEESSEVSSDADYVILNSVLMRNERVPRIRCKNYIENVVSRYTDQDFKAHFRLSRATFIFLLELLFPRLLNAPQRPGRPRNDPEKTLLIALWMMATPNCYRCVADRFDSGKSTAWDAVQKVVDALQIHLPSFVTWPNNRRAEEIRTYVQNKFEFPGVIGAIDGTHIKIAAPKHHPESYINRKGYHSMQLQLVCDHDLKITHLYTGEVGSVHDMRVFRLSGFQEMCNPNYFPENSHVLGDAAYAIQNHVMVPFKDNGHLTNAQVLFNTRLSQSRMMIERTIGLLKCRFRSLLDILPMRRTDLIPKYISACCVLHNICLLRNDQLQIPIVMQNPIIPDVVGYVPERLREQGVEKRNEIMNFLQLQENL